MIHRTAARSLATLLILCLLFGLGGPIGFLSRYALAEGEERITETVTVTAADGETNITVGDIEVTSEQPYPSDSDSLVSVTGSVTVTVVADISCDEGVGIEAYAADGGVIVIHAETIDAGSTGVVASAEGGQVTITADSIDAEEGLTVAAFADGIVDVTIGNAPESGEDGDTEEDGEGSESEEAPVMTAEGTAMLL